MFIVKRTGTVLLLVAINLLACNCSIAKSSEKNNERNVEKAASKQSRLAEIANSDASPEARFAAIDKIIDPKILVEVARKGNDEIRMRVQRRLLDLFVTSQDDEKVLAETAINSEYPCVRQEATKKVTDAALLSEIAKKSDDPLVRLIATMKLSQASPKKEPQEDAKEASKAPSKNSPKETP
ncbi:MAG: hypothetical protein M0R76_08735 [Proteobacteria bacterium]|nr:hypothetical protein [Pseudomonadota bacterium]